MIEKEIFLEESIKDYDRLINRSKSGFSYKFLKIIKIDFVPALFFLTLSIGLFLVLSSLLYSFKH